MKAATWSALSAAILLIACEGGFAQSKPGEAVPAEQQQSGTPPGQPPTSLVPPNSLDPTKPASTAGAADPAKLGQPASKPVTADPSYVIGAEDMLGVSVWGDPRLSGAVLVRPDGRISLALIGEVGAAGLTPSQLEAAIAQLLKEKQILLQPQVTVQVNQINSKKYFIQGEVLKPGPNPLVVPTTVLEALVNAGGFRDFANVKKIEIIRDSTHERFRFNYKDVIHGKHTEQNILLKPGDIIVVP